MQVCRRIDKVEMAVISDEIQLVIRTVDRTDSRYADFIDSGRIQIQEGIRCRIGVGFDLFGIAYSVQNDMIGRRSSGRLSSHDRTACACLCCADILNNRLRR